MLIIQLIYATIPVTAIPLYVSPYSAKFGVVAMKMGLIKPSQDFLNGDKVCAENYKDWWNVAKKQREARYQALSKKPTDLRSIYTKILATPYTKYPRELLPLVKVPVEAIIGEPFGPLPTAEWRENFWGCWITCQDIRKTLEWILDAKMNPARKYLRAKFPIGFLCPAGMISRPTYRRSWREAETDEEIRAAFDILHSLGKKSSLKELNRQMLVTTGQIGVVTGCECFTPTKDELEVAKRELDKRRFHSLYKDSERARRRRVNPNGEPKPRPNKRARSAPSETTQSSQVLEAEALPAERDGSAEDAIIPDDAVFPGEIIFDDVDVGALNLFRTTNQAVCHDYEYPNIELYDQLQAVSNFQQEEPDTIQATLLEFAGMDFGSWFNPESNEPGSGSTFEYGSSSNSAKHGHE